ncbi:MAG: hypothetical protein V8R80_06835 [Eubacterium sp.]
MHSSFSDLNKAAELQYGKKPELEKQLAQEEELVRKIRICSTGTLKVSVRMKLPELFFPLSGHSGGETD